MLTLITYATKRDLIQQINSSIKPDWSLKFITPFPAKADALRTQWKERANTDVVTFSRFTQDTFSLLPDRPADPLRKSRLLLKLNAFRHFIPDLKNTDYGLFKTAYQIFSDLRAYTNLAEFPDEVLSEFDEKVRTMAQLFHQGAQRAGILDEHAGVFELMARLRASEGLMIPDVAVYIFEGFTFITPAQLALIEALAIRHQVIVPIPELVFMNGHSFDWTKVLELAAHNIIRTVEKLPCIPNLNACFYPKGGLSQALRFWREQNTGDVSIILAGRDINELHLQGIPFNDTFVKYPVDVIADARDAVFENWESKIKKCKESLPGKVIFDWIALERELIIASKKLDRIRELVVLELIEKALQEVPECLADQPLDFFLMALLKEIVSLDGPRNQVIPLLENDPSLGIYSLKTLHALPSAGAVAICLDASFGQIKSESRVFSPRMEKMLSQMGPVRRPELEFLFLQADLGDLWSRSNLSFLIEDEILKHDLGWKRILSGITFNTWSTEVNRDKKPPNYEFLSPSTGSLISPITKLSASRLQDYFDCPRRYHVERIQKIVPHLEPTSEVSPLALGRIEHELLAIAWEKGSLWWSSPGQLAEEVDRLLEPHKKNNRLPLALLVAAKSEAIIGAQNGLARLSLLQEALPDLKLSFEVEITASGRTGFIDCLGVSEESIILLDFKRSKGMNPTFNGWQEGYPKIQLWFYLLALRESGILLPKHQLGVGYLFLKDLEHSWLATNQSLFYLLETKLKGWVHEWVEPEVALSRYTQFENSLFQQLLNETQFLPSPREQEVCEHCAIRPLCPRGSTNEALR